MSWQPLGIGGSNQLPQKTLDEIQSSGVIVTGSSAQVGSPFSGPNWYGIMGGTDTPYSLPHQADIMNSLLTINSSGTQSLAAKEGFNPQTVNYFQVGFPQVTPTATSNMNSGENLLNLLRLQQQMDDSLHRNELISQKEEDVTGVQSSTTTSVSPMTRPAIAKKRGEIPASGPCSVCEASNAAFHFGTLACAACSAFFRRTIAEQRKYTCSKRGAEHMNCPIDRNHRCYCRACRLQKCLAQGMDPAAVQPHRDSIGAKRKPDHEPTEIKKKKSNSVFHNDAGDNHTTMEDSFMSQAEATAQAAMFNVNLAVAEQLMALSRGVSYMNSNNTEELGIKLEPNETTGEIKSIDGPSNHLSAPHNSAEMASTSMWKSSPLSEENATPSSIESAERPSSCLSNAATASGSFAYISQQNMIENMVEQYRRMLERRRLMYCPCTIRDIIGGTLPIARPAKAMPQVRRDNIRVEIGLYVEFLNTIHPFPKFSVDDKICLLKHLSVSFTILDKYYNTMRAGGLQTNRIVHSDGTYTDLNNPEFVEFVLDGSEKQSMDKETFDKLFLQPLRDTLNELSRPMYHAGTTDTEFCALLAVLLFDPAAPGLCDSTRRIVKDARDKVYRDWFAYYRAHDVVHTEASEKVGNTLLLLPALQCAVERTAENYHLNRVFEIFDYDKILDEVFSSGEHESDHNVCVNRASC